MPDLLDELAALEASTASAMTTLPSAEPVHMPEPVPGTTTNVTLGFDGQPLPATGPQTHDTSLQPYPDFTQPAPVAPAAPEPEPAAPANEVHIPDKTPRRVYTHPGMTDENKLLLGLIDANPGLSMDAIMAAANAQLGRTAPALPVSQSPAQPSPSLPSESPSFDTVTSRLDEIDAALEDLDPVVDANEWKKLTLEHNKLNRQLPALQVQQVQQQQTADQQIDAVITETRNSVSTAYPQITPEVFAIIEDPSQPLSLIADPFAQAFAARYRQDQAADSPLLNAADYESIVASLVAQQHGILPAHLAGRQPAPVATSPGAQAPASTAAPVQRPAQPTMQQPGLAPVAAMPAISGAQHTSADRVTTQPANPLANVQLEYQQAVAAGDFEGMERLSGIMASGGHQPQAAYPGGILGISYS
jgi:hypothetical protein